MNIFKKIIGPGDQPSTSKPSIGQIFLFTSFPVIEKNDLENSISSIEPLKTKAKVDIQVQTAEALMAFVEFDDHLLQLVGLHAPVPPKVLENTIQPSNWGQDVKAAMRNHQSHILCYYQGNNPDPIEQMISVYKIAYSLYNKGIVGILDEDAWNCMPRFMINEQMKPEMLGECRKAVPLGIWTGFVKFFKDDNSIWYCTKGNHRFGVPDFAYMGLANEGNNTFDLFGNLFSYVYNYKAVLRLGDTAQLDESTFVRFREPYEYQDYINSPLGTTLVIEKISAKQINKPRTTQ